MSLSTPWLPLLAGLIVLVGLAVGARDLTQFRLRRVLAIAGVSFTEAIRRRILWITPLAIIGVLGVVQLTHPDNELTAIREAIKYCLFASGLIVIIAAVLLACTNLPKEIENRVIYTIVTKPTTRLEIVLGKVLGFAAVSAAMLVIMGIFTTAYLQLRAWKMQHEIRAALAAGAVESTNEITLRHYAKAGLLSTNALAWPQRLEVYSRLPSPDGTKWMEGGEFQFFNAPFALNENQKQALQSAASTQTLYGFFLCTMRIEQGKATAAQQEAIANGSLVSDTAPASLVAGPLAPASLSTTAPTTQATQPTTLPATQPAALAAPQIQVRFFDADRNAIDAKELNLDQYYTAFPAPQGNIRTFTVALSPTALSELAAQDRFVAEVSSVTNNVEYGVGPGSTELVLCQPMLHHGVKDAPAQQAAPEAGEYRLYNVVTAQFVGAPVTLQKGSRLGFAAGADRQLSAIGGDYAVSVPEGNYLWLIVRHKITPSERDKPGVVAPPEFYARLGRFGMQVKGMAPEQGAGSVGVYHFEDASVTGHNGKVALQLHVYIEHAGDLDVDNGSLSRASVQILNRSTGAISEPVVFEPESSHFIFLDVPVEYMTGGRFDVILRGLTAGQWLGLQGPLSSAPSVAVVTANTSFVFNLAKSMLILWLLSILVVIIAVFCSTFLSWPIAVVLTLVLLLGHWGIDQLGDALAPGSSRSIAQDIFGVSDAARARAVTSSMEALSGVLRGLSKVLPDVSQFPVIEDIDRGVSIPPPKLLGAATELAWYGLPLLALTYLILRKKEVAP